MEPSDAIRFLTDLVRSEAASLKADQQRLDRATHPATRAAYANTTVVHQNRLDALDLAIRALGGDA